MARLLPQRLLMAKVPGWPKGTLGIRRMDTTPSRAMRVKRVPLSSTVVTTSSHCTSVRPVVPITSSNSSTMKKNSSAPSASTLTSVMVSAPVPRPLTTGGRRTGKLKVTVSTGTLPSSAGLLAALVMATVSRRFSWPGSPTPQVSIKLGRGRGTVASQTPGSVGMARLSGQSKRKISLASCWRYSVVTTVVLPQASVAMMSTETKRTVPLPSPQVKSGKRGRRSVPVSTIRTSRPELAAQASANSAPARLPTHSLKRRSSR